MKNKLVSVTARLNVDTVKYIEKVSTMLNMDKSEAFRSILLTGIKEDRKQKALDMYLKGNFSVEQATRFSKLHISEFLDLMREKGIEANLTIADYDESTKNTDKLFRN